MGKIKQWGSGLGRKKRGVEPTENKKEENEKK